MNLRIVPDKLAKPKQQEPADRLFLHVQYPEWGVGLWVKEERSRRRLRFQDGELRAFKKGWYHLLEPVDPDAVDVDDLFSQLAQEHDVRKREKDALAKAKKRPPVMGFESQVRVLKSLYDGGLKSDGWKDAHRAPTDGRSPRKGHIDPSMELAQKLLSEEALDKLIADEDWDAVVEAVYSVLKGTSLVSPSKTAKPMRSIPEDTRMTFALALHRLLHGEGRMRERMDDWIDTLTGTCGLVVTWPMATALPALVHPDKQVCCKRRIVNLQARSVKPGVVLAKRPSGRGYRKMRRVVRAANKRLIKAGQDPRDMLDVAMFMTASLSPRGQRTLDDLQGLS